jgi:hypothetical protein
MIQIMKTNINQCHVVYKSCVSQLKGVLKKVHCKKCRLFYRRVNSRVADISSKPAYSKWYCQPEEYCDLFWVYSLVWEGSAAT